MKKKILIIIFLLFLFPNITKAIVLPTDEFYVNDYANVLSSDTEEYILQRSLALNEADGTQIVVVTVNDLDGMDVESYANKLFNEFGIGKEKENNGLLLLLVVDERIMRVEVGDGLGGILPDGKTGRFQDNYMIPYLKDNKWDEGVRNGYDAFYTEIVTLRELKVDYTKPIEKYEDNSTGYTLTKTDELIVNFAMPGAFLLALISGLMTKKAKDDKKKKLRLLFLSLFGINLFLIFYFNYFILFPALIFYLIFYIVFSSDIMVSSSTRYYGGRSYSGRSYSSRSSSRSFSGRGGRSSGGGSTRRF